MSSRSEAKGPWRGLGVRAGHESRHKDIFHAGSGRLFGMLDWHLTGVDLSIPNGMPGGYRGAGKRLLDLG